MTYAIGVALICGVVLVSAAFIVRALGEVANQIAQLRTEQLRYHTRMGQGHLLREIGYLAEKSAEYLQRIADREH